MTFNTLFFVKIFLNMYDLCIELCYNQLKHEKRYEELGSV